MSNAIKVAVVTGANKGIGYAVVKDLAKKFDGDVILTARNSELGLNACKELEKEGVKVKYHQLDIDNQESIDTFAKYIKYTYNGLDVLINNAAIAYKVADTTPFADQATNTIRINFTGTLNLCKALFPLLRAHARVVNVSSRAGMLKIVKDESIRNRLKSDDLTTDELVKILDEFVKLSQTGENARIATTAYGMSKVGLTALTRIQQRELNKDSRADLVVNALCPGYVKTDMSSQKGHLTPEQGADTVVYLALLPPNIEGPKGEFWAERKPIDWTNLNFSWS